MKPSLAVLITYYGEQNLLTECLETLLLGPDAPDEILVHDDASEAPASDFLPPGLNVTIMRAASNQGPGRGRNALLKASRSDYVHFHDADDWFSPEWCTRVRHVIEQSGTDAVFTEVSTVFQGQVFAERVLGLDRLAEDHDLTRFCLRGSMLVPAGTYRREAVLAIGGYREGLWQAEDFDFHVRLAASGVKYAVLQDPLVVTRLRAEGRSQNQLEVWLSAADALAALAEELPAQYRPDLSEAAARTGSVLFRLGATPHARKAFMLAKELGRPTYAGQHPWYRWIARTFEPEAAERVAAGYRTLVPQRLRGGVRRAV